jgi:hypothetical protein
VQSDYTTEDEAAGQIAAELHGYSIEFDELCAARHQLGAEKYGPGKFLTVDTIEEALSEIADLANYARYTYIKLRMLQEAILEQGTDAGVINDHGFMGSRQATSVRRETPDEGSTDTVVRP